MFDFRQFFTSLFGESGIAIPIKPFRRIPQFTGLKSASKFRSRHTLDFGHFSDKY